MMIGEKGFRRLDVWQKADKLAFETYRLTANFPKEEIYGITSQIRRAGLSVPVNIVEGYGRQRTGEIKQFVRIALGSLSEVEYLMEFSRRLGYLSESDFVGIKEKREELGRMLWSFYKVQK